MNEAKIISQSIRTLRAAAGILPAEKQSEFLKPLEAIEARFKDKDFYLAVIGNFNAGKSTFLNAILGMDILSVGGLPTTAIPTYIRWNRTEVLQERAKDGRVNIPDDDSPCIQVMLADGTKLFVDGFDEQDLQAFRTATGVELPEDAGGKVDFLTTNNSLASKIKSIYLSFPERKEFQNFCLIDTPGINPGEESNAVHILNTQSVLRENADCALILYQAREAMTRNTKDFIEKNAAHLMGNAIVILTYWDIIPPKDRSKIVDYVKSILSTNFHQNGSALTASPKPGSMIDRVKNLMRDEFSKTDSVVRPVSALKAREYQSGYDTSSDCKEYAKSFDVAIKDIMALLRSRRVEIVTKRLLELVDGLAVSLQEVIETSRKELEEQGETLKNNSWSSVQSEVMQLQRTFRQRTENLLSYYESSLIGTRIAMKINSAADDVCAKVSSASDRSSLNNYCDSYYKNAMASAQDSAWQEIRSIVFSDIDGMQKKFRREVEECLRAHGRHLGGMDSLGSGSSLSVNIDNPLSIDSKIEGSSMLTGIIGGAILWGLLGPIGGIIGWWLLDDYFFENKKTEIKSAIRSEVQKYISAVSQSFTAQVDRHVISVIDWSAHILDSYKNMYSALYAQAEESYNQRKAENAQKLKEYAKALSSLAELRAAVTETKAVA